MQVLSEAERDWLMLALLMMRRYEAQYRFDRNPATWELFFKSYRSFEEKLSALLVDDQVKAKLGDLVKGYSSTLAQWNRQSQNIQKSALRDHRDEPAARSAIAGDHHHGGAAGLRPPPPP